MNPWKGWFTEKLNVAKKNLGPSLQLVNAFGVYCLSTSPSTGLDKVPRDLPSDTTLLDLQNNKITEIKEGDFRNLKDLHVSE